MEHAKLKRGSRGKGERGVALIIVLMLVVLTTIVILAFFLSVQTETKSVRSVISAQSSRQLADIGVQSVISQIQQATTQGSTVAWASQPGLIRCYNNAGAAKNWYKLYSAANMILTSPTESLTLFQPDIPASAWATPGSANYGVFTDINSPIISSSGSLVYPIVNPTGATSIAAANSTSPVIGFDIATASTPGYTAGATAGSNASATNNPAAMPVRWIYVLRDGTQVPAVAGTTPGTVTVTGASSSNPIVGRVAYWTDDETCKVNVNTAADGTYFDTPRFNSAVDVSSSVLTTEAPPKQDTDRISDRQMGATPPIFGEYQRFVGNPAQTRLTYALNVLPGISSLSLVQRSNLFSDITPFMQWGGSFAGTQVSGQSLTAANALLPPTRQTPYATLDEWMFNTQLNSTTRWANPGPSQGNDPVTNLPNPPVAAPIVTNTALQQLRFFLSANSDAPEVNLFGQPRISIWPLTSDLLVNPTTTKYATTFDKLIAQAATLAPSTTSIYPYYFSRTNAGSPTIDWSGTANALMGSSSATRNQNLFSLLRKQASTAIPGYGGTFTAKYTIPETDQILTEIFDYIRSTNSSDTLLLKTGKGQDYTYSGTAVSGTGTTYETASGSAFGAGQVTPIYMSSQNFGGIYNTKGFGRFYSISDVILDITQVRGPPTATTAVINGVVPLQGVIFLGLHSPSLGFPDIDPHLRVVIQTPGSPGTLNMSLKSSSDGTLPLFGPPNNGANASRTVYSAIPTSDISWNSGKNHAFLWGGPNGIRTLLCSKKGSYSVSNTQNTFTANPNNYAFCGIPIFVSPGSTLSMSQTSLEILIYYTNASSTDPKYGDGAAGDGSNGSLSPADLIQDITINFPAFSGLPMPTNTNYDLGNRISSANYGTGNAGFDFPIVNGDIVQSLVAGYNGDNRLIAAQRLINDVTTGTASPPTSYNGFVPHQYYGQPNKPSSGVAMAFSVADPFIGDSFEEAQESNDFSPAGTGQLVPLATYTRPPATGMISTSLAGKIGSPDFTGDWDNGWANFPDGAYINKTDEAQQQYETSNSAYYDGTANSYLAVFASPNRNLASPVMFGSLPTGVPMADINGNSLAKATPWQTLLFRPQPTHPGAASPEDELMLDWFWMPVVEPYAISTAMATVGKVNMNYQIAPFTYITRATALMSVLGSEYVISVPTSSGSLYKNLTNGGSGYPTYRSPVKVLKADNVTYDDDDGTLRQFRDRFANGLIFKSAAEICDIYLEPSVDSSSGTALSWGAGGPVGDSTTYIKDAQTYWSSNQLTGDNSRERPYNGLYSRLTTKSNTYTVHVRAQTLAGSSSAPVNTWVENPQQITSEYRGSVTINRYLDPQDPNIPDFAASSALLKNSLDNYYKYRVVETRRFLP
jgi:hypothetical protein